jgi:medium-chain acyl-[acyl-carrier-protein] hydrolase
MNKIFTKKFRIESYEVDFRGKALPVSLLNYLQDAAADHSGLLGYSLFELLKENRTWLLSRYHLKIFRHPALGESVTVSTWPSGAKGIFALRDYEIIDEKAALIAAATSSWVLWHLAAKQASRLDERLAGRFVLERRAIDDPFSPLPPVERADRELSFRAEIQDININRHVNYAAYIQWALETAPENILWTHVLSEIEVDYRAEAFYADEVVSKIQAIADMPSPAFRHGIFHKDKGGELARLRTAWVPVR